MEAKLVDGMPEGGPDIDQRGVVQGEESSRHSGGEEARHPHPFVPVLLFPCRSP